MYFSVCELDVPCQLPAEMDDWHNGLVGMQLVELVRVDALPELLVRRRTHVPGNVVAPALKI